MSPSEHENCACGHCRLLQELRFRYAIRGMEDREPDALDELDRFILQHLRGEVDAT